ncbi:MAG: hypothetical protein Roseis2KO_21030 [Roseivirga sp.]
MKRLFTIILATLLINTSYGQKCGTSSGASTSLSSLRTIQVLNECFLDPSVVIGVNVKYHIVRETNGRGGFNYARLQDVTAMLNAALNPHNIDITSVGYDLIDNSTFYRNLTHTGFDALVQTNNDPNALNIYIIRNFSGPALGRANGVTSRELVVSQNSAETHILTHEVGHSFNLQHTFHGSGYEQTATSCPERTFTGPNNTEQIDCVGCGDYVCDTPPHDQAPWNVTSPVLLQNLMTVFDNTTEFTPGQGTRMREAFAGSPVLRNIINNPCPKLIGPDEVCDNQDVTYTLTDATSSLWEVSSNLQVVSSNLTEIVVRRSPSAQTTTGYVRATTASGVVLQQNLKVGTPRPSGFVSVLIDDLMGRIKVRVIPVSGATTYEWYVNGVLQSGPGLTSDNVTLTPVMNCSIMEYTIGVRAIGPCGTSWMYYEHHPNPCFQPNGYRYSFAPNPVSNTLTISKITGDNNTAKARQSLKKDSYELHDLTGYKVMSGMLTDKTMIDIQNLKRGRYVLTIRLEGGAREKHHIIVE